MEEAEAEVSELETQLEKVGGGGSPKMGGGPQNKGNPQNGEGSLKAPEMGGEGGAKIGGGISKMRREGCRKNGGGP